MVVDLSSLPKPEVIEELDYEAIVARQKEIFGNLWEAVRIDHPELPPYDVSMLETDPVVIQIEAESFRELRLRAKANDVARARLLAYAKGTNLDHVAAEHGVTRLEGELDPALVERIILWDQGSSSAGPEEWYEFWARTASVLVKDAKAYRSGLGPELEIAILSTDNGGVPTQDILDAVEAMVTDPGIIGLNDIVTVVAAVNQTVNIVGDVWLLPDTPIEVFNGLEAILRQANTDEGGIGFDINLNWLYAKLTQPGVSKVVLSLPAASVVADNKSAIAIGTVALTFKGRSR